MKKYSAEYFIAKFEAIPDEKWTADGSYQNDKGQCCALGHLGADLTSRRGSPEERQALRNLFMVTVGLPIISVNDGLYGCHLFGDTPKERVINALTLIASGALKDA